MRTDDFDYELPPELIAQRAAEPRDASRLFYLPSAGPAVHTRFSEIGRFLRAGDALVLNDTRVLAARLHGTFRDTGGNVEALLVRREADGTWEAMLRPGRRARPGREVVFGGATALIETRLGEGLARLRFAPDIDPTALGEVPLPPYITEPVADPERYQTVYARVEGSAAAPTAGLHFTPELLDRLRAAGIATEFITLHVGPGTFRPVKVEDPTRHPMHEEWYSIDEATAQHLQETRRRGGRIIAVGTTVVRTLEQVASASPDGALRASTGWTRLLILPGYRFRAIDLLITNFHLPRSTLLMLISAFAGRERILAAYAEAVQLRYRFYSFGDAMLLERAEQPG
ncbi:MAG TPA: tRNA preQ1(34) S-adenosylmethionine ribosyltransferase-isomerase QueA [Dehalococcoidia bacterium]|nr:tRNA preQ1(34) S-adenosylmethionine ribosyltransferase-isomerase QueA [Dehalococcoidia bacterium]